MHNSPCFIRLRWSRITDDIAEPADASAVTEVAGNHEGGSSRGSDQFWAALRGFLTYSSLSASCATDRHHSVPKRTKADSMSAIPRVQFEGTDDELPEATRPVRTNTSDVSRPTKRMRWATQRQTGQSAVKKRLSILNRAAKPSPYEEKQSAQRNHASITDDSPMGQEIQPEESNSRTIWFNLPLPDHAKTEQGLPKAHYSRNKVRTAKYTPLSFIPKNLWFQFHNIANVYFLFIIVLGIFSLFGVDNPGLAAVPLIVILVLTAAKDGIEDWRRTVLDNELNNSPIYRLVGWNNVNASEDNISLWRRVKKASTKFIIGTYRSVNQVVHKKKAKSPDKSIDGGQLSRQDTNMTRATINTRRTSTSSIQSDDGEDIAMTPVSSPGIRTSAQVNGYLAPESPTTMRSFDTAPEHNTHLTVGGNAPSGLNTKRSSKRKSTLTAKDYGSVLNRDTQPSGTAAFKKDYWKNVQVGDFLRIFNDEQIPADVVVLSTSDPDGACYVETKNLDGETNLKVRNALQASRAVRHARDCEQAEFTVQSEGPQPNLYAYNAVMKWHEKDIKTPEGPKHERAEPIGINNLLLRGCNLRNTEWVLGVVVFTGAQTKIMLNAGATPSKRARMAKELNRSVIYNFIILFLMCLVAGLTQGIIWSTQGGYTAQYFEFGSLGGSPPVDGIVTFWSAVILFQNLVPISLYISLEIIRSAQAFFIYSDTYMYYEKLDYPCTPKSWNISDDLGQIEYIFSDKTGTLTQNVMEFKKCTINGRPYGEAYTEAEAGLRRRQGVDVEKEAAEINAQIAESRVEMLQALRKMHDNDYLKDENLTFISPDYVHDLSGRSGEEQRRACEHFMIALALCHTVITETTPGDPPEIEFKAQSPDEAALVATARDCGFTVLGRNNDDLLVNVLGEDRNYQVLNTLEFNSTRKRMSAIIRMPDGGIKLFCKGADSMVYSRLAKGQQQELRKATAENLEVFAREGLRTLCVAERDLSEEYYQEWVRDHDFAAQAIQDREDRLEEVADRIERELMLIGGTAIEDRLQDGVPDTIALLGRAGIKLWVLTGDKVETAINIGFSCNLLSNEMELILFDLPEATIEDAGRLLDQHLKTFNMTGSDAELKEARKNHEPPDPTHALIIDGESLKLVLSDELRQRFLLLCKQCKSVLCCRVSPAQKAAVVALVKHGLNIMALSIGDGANDVAMIQEADVGVGIAGEEGRQAVMSSDYAIGQFRFLQRLVLVHGRWSYKRLAQMTGNFFYKVCKMFHGVFDRANTVLEHRLDVRTLLVPNL